MLYCAAFNAMLRHSSKLMQSAFAKLLSIGGVNIACLSSSFTKACSVPCFVMMSSNQRELSFPLICAGTRHMKSCCHMNIWSNEGRQVWKRR